MIARRGLLPACVAIGNGRRSCNPNNNIFLTNAMRQMTVFHSPPPGPGRAFHPNDNQVVKRPVILERHRLVHTRRSSTFKQSAYVHPLSQIVLEHLQSRHGTWVTDVGLDTGLQLKEDGTFVLRFPGAGGGVVAGEDAAGDIEAEGRAAEETMTDHGSIWTVYEAAESKHYLCVSKGSLVGQYLLQDNTKSAWHTEKRSTPERIQDAVDGMVEQIQEIGIKVSNN